MKQTLFPAFVTSKFSGVALSISQKIDKEADKYLFRTMLSREYSVDGNWNAVSNKNTNIMADVVAFDSPLPLKNRESFGSVSGEIPKIGMEMRMNETQLTNVDTMIKLGGENAIIIGKIFEDIGKCVRGIYEKTEYAFLLGLSLGVTLIDDTTNVGRSVRLDYGYLAENKFTASASWATPATAPTISDIDRVLEAANEGSTIRYIMMDKPTFNKILNSAEGKQMYATYVGNFGTNLQTPSKEKFLEAFKTEKDAEIIITDRNFNFQKNGVTTKGVKAWSPGKIIFLQDMVVGSLVWAELAEKNHKVSGVDYQEIDQYILTAKFSVNEPTVGEVSRAQARVLPVIADVANIYQLDTTQVGG